MREVDVSVSPLRRVTRSDSAGSETLYSVLKWCEKHNEPVWVYHDGSFACPFDMMIGRQFADSLNVRHSLVDPPWEGGSIVVDETYFDELLTSLDEPGEINEPLARAARRVIISGQEEAD